MELYNGFYIQNKTKHIFHNHLRVFSNDYFSLHTPVHLFFKACLNVHILVVFPESWVTVGLIPECGNSKNCKLRACTSRLTVTSFLKLV